MSSFKILKLIALLFITTSFLNACDGKLPGADARKYPSDPKKRVAQNIAQGKGFRLMDTMSVAKKVAFLNLQVQMNYGEHH